MPIVKQTFQKCNSKTLKALSEPADQNKRWNFKSLVFLTLYPDTLWAQNIHSAKSELRRDAETKTGTEARADHETN